MMKLQIVALFVGILAGTANVTAQNKDAQRRAAEKKAIAAIEKLGGYVILDEQKPDNPVSDVNAGGTGLSDADLLLLKRFHELQSRYLDGTMITDSGLVQLKGLTNLKTLDISNTGVISAGLAHLRE